MSIKTSLNTLSRSLRPFTTISSRLNTNTTSTSSTSTTISENPNSSDINSASSSNAAANDGFGFLAGILSDENVFGRNSSSSSSTVPNSDGPQIVDITARRGYDPNSVPPSIEPLLDLMTNLLMKHGKKGEAQAKVSKILSLIQGASNQAPLPLLHRAIELSSPSVRVVSNRARAKTVPVPLALNERQRVRQAISWIFKAAEKGRKSGLPRDVRIAREILAVLEGNSDVYKWLEERNKVATAVRSNLPSRRQ